MWRFSFIACLAIVAAGVLGGSYFFTVKKTADATEAPIGGQGLLLRTNQWTDDNAVVARAKCEEETEDWRYKDCLERIPGSSIVVVPSPGSSDPLPSLVRRANEGEVEASLKYGYHIVAKSVVENTEPLEAIPYLMTAALAGDIGAHVQLGLIEAVSRQDGDLVKAWAHFDIALQQMPQTAPDYRRSQMHLDEISAGLSDTERATAKALSEEYLETMRSNRNTLK